MPLRSRKSDKTLALLTGTLVVRQPSDEEYARGAEVAALVLVQHRIDTWSVLRRRGKATVHSNAKALEVRCPVEYGPVLGGYESDLRQQVDRILQPGEEGEVLDIRREPLEEDTARKLLEELEAKVTDINLPLPARKVISRTVERLRAFLKDAAALLATH